MTLKIGKKRDHAQAFGKETTNSDKNGAPEESLKRLKPDDKPANND